jgi:hypothetical protein
VTLRPRLRRALLCGRSPNRVSRAYEAHKDSLLGGVVASLAVDFARVDRVLIVEAAAD